MIYAKLFMLRSAGFTHIIWYVVHIYFGCFLSDSDGDEAPGEVR